MDQLGAEKYVALTTFTRDGRPKTTPVWITGADGVYRFTTEEGSWKVKRLRNDPRVEVRPSDARGNVEEHAPIFTGTGAVLTDDVSVEETRADIGDKYGIQAQMIFFLHRVRKLMGKPADTVAIVLQLAPAGA